MKFKVGDIVQWYDNPRPGIVIDLDIAGDPMISWEGEDDVEIIVYWSHHIKFHWSGWNDFLDRIRDRTG